MVRALSISPFAAQLLSGPRQSGVGVGHGYVLFDQQVMALTPPGRPRMPNGVETEIVVANGERVFVGDDALRTASAEVTAGTVWDPRPHPRIALSLRPRPQLDIGTLAGRGPGLTPLGDDILVGYLAAAALAGASGAAVAACAARTGRATTALSRTLLRLAARGALPEAAHHLLVDGDPEPLLAFGASSGKGIAFGLALFGVGVGDTEAESEERLVRLGETGFTLVIQQRRGLQPMCAHAGRPGARPGEHQRRSPVDLIRDASDANANEALVVDFARRRAGGREPFQYQPSRQTTP